MLFLYRLGIGLFSLLMRFAALWHPKARLWVNGRKELMSHISRQVKPSRNYVWFHFASLGEFEQGRPVMEALKRAKPETRLILTFFSPSGYEIRKNYALAEHVFYLPLDTPANAAEFIRLIQPKMAVFTKYEYWYFFFRELSREQIPLYIISGIFRKNQIFFKWYGGLHRKMLGFVSHFFVQNQESVELLKQLDFENVSLAGDTRFDRVSELASSAKELSEVQVFCGKQKVLVAGSTWPKDEVLLAELLQQHKEWKLIIAPHEITETGMEALMNRFPQGMAIYHSKLHALNSKYQGSYSILIIDSIGLLSSLYQFADIAYIGGGFGKGIHNTLEAAGYGVPVIFGPNYHKFQEAKDLINSGAGFSIQNQEGLEKIFQQFQDDERRKNAGEKASHYVTSRVGATTIILKQIADHRII